MDENTPADAPVPAPAETKARSAPKPKKKLKRAKHAAATKAAAPAAAKATSSAPSGALLVAVYVVLGLLVIGTSFYTGYLVGKNAQAIGGPKGGDSLGGIGDGETLTIVEYSDFECPFCGRVEPTLTQLREQYGDRIEIVYKHFPLESIHPNALNAAVASECAREQGEDEFWAYHAKLFENQQALDAASLKRYAADIGLNTGEFNSCLDNQETIAKVRADIQEAEGRGVQGTPSFWIKDELVVGALPYEMFKTKIDEKLSGKAAAPAAPSVPQEPAAPAAPVDVAAGKNIMGEEDAPVLIVEFTDYQCPFCKRHYTQTEAQLIDQYVKTGKARYAVRHFPLGFHAQAQKAAEAAECAADQGKFWEMHETLFEKGNGDGTGLAVADLKKYAADLGLNTRTFNSCLDNGDKAAIVQKDFQEGQAAGVSGTPSFFINGKQLVGAQPLSEFQRTIDAELSN